jgi:hypothetical protein
LEENPVKLRIESENAVLDSGPVTNMGEEGADRQATLVNKTGKGKAAAVALGRPTRTRQGREREQAG